MSDEFLNKMTAKEYNDYHRELFGDEWEDVEYEGKLENKEQIEENDYQLNKQEVK